MPNNLQKKADDKFSKHIRKRDNCTCFTCGYKGDISVMHCGHFMVRGRLGTRYDEQNCNCQCETCNKFKDGNLDVYAEKLKEKYGDDIVEKLKKKSLKYKKFFKYEYIEIINRYN